MWEKKNTQIVSQNQVNEKVSQKLVMAVNSDGSKNYRSEGYGFEFTIPKAWTSFRDVKIEKSVDGTPSIKFLFETKDSRYFDEYNCQGKCVPMFFIGIISHDTFNSFYDDRWAITNVAGKPGVIRVSDTLVFIDNGYSNDPPSDLINLKSELPMFYRSFWLF